MVRVVLLSCVIFFPSLFFSGSFRSLCIPCSTIYVLPNPIGVAKQVRLCHSAVFSFLVERVWGVRDDILPGVYRFSKSEIWSSQLSRLVSSSICYGILTG